MTTQTTPLTTVDRIRAMMKRHELNQPKTEKLLGVAHGTLGNWLTGTRTPNQVVARLMDILELAEVFHPSLVRDLVAKASARD